MQRAQRKPSHPRRVAPKVTFAMAAKAREQVMTPRGAEAKRTVESMCPKTGEKPRKFTPKEEGELELMMVGPEADLTRTTNAGPGVNGVSGVLQRMMGERTKANVDVKVKPTREEPKTFRPQDMFGRRGPELRRVA